MNGLLRRRLDLQEGNNGRDSKPKNLGVKKFGGEVIFLAMKIACVCYARRTGLAAASGCMLNPRIDINFTQSMKKQVLPHLSSRHALELYF